MPSIATYPAKPGAVIKEELFAEHGYCRREVNMQLLNESDEVGLLCTIAANGEGNIVEDAAAVAALTTEEVGIMVDTGVYDDSAVTTSDADRVGTAVFFRGPAVVALKNCSLGDGSKVSALSGANQTILADLLEAQGIKVSDALKTQ